MSLSDRGYFAYAARDAKKPMPVVLLLHGGGATAAQMRTYCDFDTVADKLGFLVVYPDAVEKHWNDGRNDLWVRSHRSNVDDVQFLRSVVDKIGEQYSIDRSRLFVTGISNGGFMAHRLAAEASDLVAGIAPVTGGMAPAIAERFAPEYPVSVLIIQGDADPVVPIGGGFVGFPGAPGEVVAASETLERYLTRNGNHGDADVTTLDGNDGTSVVMNRYPDGPGGVKTWYYLVKNGGHAWPGRPPYLAERSAGKASQAFSASDAISEFFKSCPPRTTEH